MHFAKCHYTEGTLILTEIMVGVILLNEVSIAKRSVIILSVIVLSVFMRCHFAKCHFAKCHCAECDGGMQKAKDRFFHLLPMASSENPN
jgi:hypothetical protein